VTIGKEEKKRIRITYWTILDAKAIYSVKYLFVYIYQNASGTPNFRLKKPLFPRIFDQFKTDIRKTRFPNRYRSGWQTVISSDFNFLLNSIIYFIVFDIFIRFIAYTDSNFYARSFSVPRKNLLASKDHSV
jgi:hypothetical protein